MEAVPQLFPFPKCVKLTIKTGHHSHTGSFVLNTVPPFAEITSSVPTTVLGLAGLLAPP